MKNKKYMMFLCCFALLAISSCARQPEPESFDPLGFFTGLWHGLIISFSFIASIFTDVRIYAYPNSGFLYDFGYLIGIGVWLTARAGLKKR